MTLVGKARIHRGLDYGSTVGQEATRKKGTLLNQVGVRRSADLPHESPQQLVAADPGEFCKLGQPYR
jgi:hypothetical protein